MRIVTLGLAVALVLARAAHAMPDDIKAYCNQVIASVQGGTPEMIHECIESEEAARSRIKDRTVDAETHALCAQFESSWEYAEKCWNQVARERRLRARQGQPKADVPAPVGPVVE